MSQPNRRIGPLQLRVYSARRSSGIALAHLLVPAHLVVFGCAAEQVDSDGTTIAPQQTTGSSGTGGTSVGVAGQSTAALGNDQVANVSGDSTSMDQAVVTSTSAAGSQAVAATPASAGASNGGAAPANDSSAGGLASSASGGSDPMGQGGAMAAGAVSGQAGAAQAGTAMGGGATGGGATGGSATGGAAGQTPSSGCGANTWPESERYTLDVSGTSREYLLEMPDNYDPSQPYRLIFGWHWRGGQASDVAGNGVGGGPYYGLESRANGSAIFVAPEGIDNGWANTGGRDNEFLQAMLDRFNGELCIDQSRIFSTGFSYGGMMSLAVGCAFGDVFRAIAPMSGAFYSGCEDGNAPIAFWGAHGDNDTVVPLGDGQAGRDEFLQRNHCGTQTMPVDPSPCVTYEGCDAGYPVTWCEFSGGHSPPNFSADALWDFFSQF